MKQRKIPLRRCTGCKQMKSKKDLLRIVRDPAGVFTVDRTSKKSGRGAYVCPDPECFEKAYKSKGLERSFQTPVPAEIYAALKQEIENNHTAGDTDAR